MAASSDNGRSLIAKGGGGRQPLLAVPPADPAQDVVAMLRDEYRAGSRTGTIAGSRTSARATTVTVTESSAASVRSVRHICSHHFHGVHSFSRQAALLLFVIFLLSSDHLSVFTDDLEDDGDILALSTTSGSRRGTSPTPSRRSGRRAAPDRGRVGAGSSAPGGGGGGKAAQSSAPASARPQPPSFTNGRQAEGRGGVAGSPSAPGRGGGPSRGQGPGPAKASSANGRRFAGGGGGG